jgi:hypothetical protein
MFNHFYYACLPRSQAHYFATSNHKNRAVLHENFTSSTVLDRGYGALRVKLSFLAAEFACVLLKLRSRITLARLTLHTCCRWLAFTVYNFPYVHIHHLLTVSTPPQDFAARNFSV